MVVLIQVSPENLKLLIDQNMPEFLVTVSGVEIQLRKVPCAVQRTAAAEPSSIDSR